MSTEPRDGTEATCGLASSTRSACVFCPLHSDAEWRRLRDTRPGEFAKAVLYEGLLQKAMAQTKLSGKPYLHRDTKPLTEIDFTEDETK